MTVNMVEVKINDEVKVGGNNPCFIIAEVGQNHQGDIEIAKRLIKAAKVSHTSNNNWSRKTFVRFVYIENKTKRVIVFLQVLHGLETCAY